MKIKHFLLPLFLILFLLTGSFLRASAAELVEVLLNPSVTSPTNGQTFTISVAINTAGNPVNAAQINLVYPVASADFVQVNTVQSVFAIQAEQKNIGGVVKIARGSIKPQIGDAVKFADVVFRAKDQMNTSDIKISGDSMVVRSTDNKNILTSNSSMMTQQQSIEGMPKRDPYKPSVQVKNHPNSSGLLQNILSAIFGIFGFGKNR